MARRGRGEGSIYRRADGRWTAALTLGKDGRRRSYYGKTRTEVAEQLSSALRDHQRGLLPTGKRMTVEQFLTSWLEDSVRGRVRPSTETHYDLVVRHLVKGLGDLDLDKLTPAHVEHYLRSKARDSGLAGRTINHHRAVLRAALNRGMKWGLIYRNAAALSAAPRIDAAPSRFLDPQEAAAVIEAVKGDGLEALYRCALALGLRQGEALGLQWNDVEFEQRRLHVRRQLQRVKGQPQLLPLKTERSRRTLVLPHFAVTALRDHQVRQQPELGALPLPSALVFCKRDGSPLTNSNVTPAFQDLLRKAGLARMRFHDLRHSAASLLLAQGVPARVVMETLGHSTIATTMDIYSHVMPSLLQESADAMDRALGGRS